MHSVSRATVLLLLIMASSIVNSQPPNKKNNLDFSRRLRPGDTVPEVIIHNIRNYDDKPFRISDFKGKVLILDFWGVYCSPCIAAMPKMEEIQWRFDGKVQVVMVTKNSRTEVDKLAQRSKILQRTKLPSIIGDTVLGKLFPYDAVPSHVWINQQGKVAYITDGYNTTLEKVSQFLSGKNPDLYIEENRPGFETDLTANFRSDSASGDLRYYSLLKGKTPYTSSSSVGFVYDSLYNITGFKAINIDVLSILQQPYLNEEMFNEGIYLPNRIIWGVKDKYPYTFPEDNAQRGEWQKRYEYCYEMKVPKTTEKQAFEYVASDMRRFFGIAARLENRKMHCLVLVRTNNEDKLKSKSSQHIFHPQEDYSGFEGVNIRPLDFIIHAFGEANSKLPMPVVDGTNYTGRIDLTINADLRNLPAVRKELTRYGLDIIEQERTIPMIVITEEK